MQFIFNIMNWNTYDEAIHSIQKILKIQMDNQNPQIDRQKKFYGRGHELVDCYNTSISQMTMYLLPST